MYLSEATGHVFDSKRPTKSLYWDGQEKIIDGGQKWYSPLKTKDGVYTFNVETAPAGINEMSLCLTEQVEIKGVAYDDFIKEEYFLMIHSWRKWSRMELGRERRTTS
ncbi:hypothetical protein LQK80_36935 [Bacillus thuringiensis]|nr:hypothetical protein [Bacillus thuringiensis]